MNFVAAYVPLVLPPGIEQVRILSLQVLHQCQPLIYQETCSRTKDKGGMGWGVGKFALTLSAVLFCGVISQREILYCFLLSEP